MPEVSQASFCYPPQFPEKGRLPFRAGQVHRNLQRQSQLERDYHDALCLAAGRRVTPPCCRTLHISLFFGDAGRRDVALYRQEDGAMVAGAQTPLFVDPALATPSPLMTAERLAEVQKAINEIWRANETNVRGLKDVQV